MADNEYIRIKDQLVEQKITKQLTVTANTSGTLSINIPQGKIVYLKGYGYTWFTSCTFHLNTGNRLFPARTDQEGSPSLPVIYGNPFRCRPGGKLELTVDNADSSDHTFDIVFYILTNDHLDEISTGGELLVATGAPSSSGSKVTIYDSTGTTAAGVDTDGLEVHIDKALPAGTNAIGSLVQPSAVVVQAKTTTGAAAEVLTSAAVADKVTIQADPTNTDYVLLGNATNQYLRLDPGQSVDLKISNLNLVYIKRNSANVTVNVFGS